MQFSQSSWKFAWQRFIAEVIIGLLFPSLFWKGGSPWHIAYHLLTSLFSIPPPIKSLYCNNLYVLFFYSLFFSMSAICTEFYMSIPVPNVSFCTICFLHYIVEAIGLITIMYQSLIWISSGITQIQQYHRSHLCCKFKPQTGKCFTAMTYCREPLKTSFFRGFP